MEGFASFAAFVVSMLCCENARHIGRRLGVVDRPDGKRKLHVRPTPLVGGIALGLALLFLELGWLVTQHSHTRLFTALILATVGFWTIGFLDDRREIKPIFRILASIALFWVILQIEPRLVLTDINFGPPFPSFTLGEMAVPFTLLCLVGLMNAINMADGRNGIVLGIAICWGFGLAQYADIRIQLFLGAAVVCLVTTLVYNWRGRLFLGDSGSYMLGAFLGLLTIYAYNNPRSEFPAAAAAIWLIVPVLDCLRLIVFRFARGKLPWRGDRNHLHHYLERHLPWGVALPLYLAVAAGPGFLALLWPTAAPHLFLLALTLYLTTLFWVGRRSAAITAVRRPTHQRTGG